MALNPTKSGDSQNWNYSKPDKPGYSTTLEGTVIAIQEVQAMNFGQDGPTTPKFWDNGQPMWNIRLVICGPKGGFRTWTITPASKAAKEGKKKHVHIDLFKLAGGEEFMNLIGKTIRITTKEPPEGYSYGQKSPRPWHVELVEGGPYSLDPERYPNGLDPIYKVPQLLANQSVSGGVMTPTPQSAAPMTAEQAAAYMGGQAAPQNAPAPQAAPQEDIPF